MPTRLDWGQIGPPPSLSGLRFEPFSYTDRTNTYIITTPVPATVICAPDESENPTENAEEFYDIWEDVCKIA